MDRFRKLLAGFIEVGGPEQVGGKGFALATALIYKAAQLNFGPTLPVSNSELCRLSGLTLNELYPARNRLLQFQINSTHAFYYSKPAGKHKPGLYAINYPLLLFQYETALEVERTWCESVSDFQILIFRFWKSDSDFQIKSDEKPLRTVRPRDPPLAEIAKQSEEDIEEEDRRRRSSSIPIPSDYSMVERYLCQRPDPPAVMLSHKEAKALLDLAKEGIPAEFCIEVIDSVAGEMQQKGEVIYNPRMYLIRCIRNAWARKLKEGKRDDEREHLKRKYADISE